MKKIISLLIVLVNSCISHSIASTVIDTQYTNDGKLVELNGLEWLSLDQTAGLSRLTVQDNLNNNIYGSGWRYATRTEVENLLDSLWGGTTEGWSIDNYDGAKWFGSTFNWLGSATDSEGNTTSESHFFFGNITDCGGLSDSCIGSVRINEYEINPNSSTGFFMDGFGLSIGVSSINEAYTLPLFSSQYNQASMLVRNTVSTIPVPGGLILFISGLFGMGLFGRNNK